jgi:hypothetical protein
MEDCGSTARRQGLQAGLIRVCATILLSRQEAKSGEDCLDFHVPHLILIADLLMLDIEIVLGTFLRTAYA